MGGKHRLSKDRCRTGYYVRKYLPESLNEKSSNKAYHNWIYFRLAEMYLNYAEALNEGLPVPSTEVYNAVNAVRKRSGMPALPQGLSQTAMRQRIKNERNLPLKNTDGGMYADGKTGRLTSTVRCTKWKSRRTVTIAIPTTKLFSKTEYLRTK